VMVTPPFVIGPPEIDYIVRNLRTAVDDVYATL
jgi:adenosylmethionine-8-amino-7-oxononanoate aminotransferase